MLQNINQGLVGAWSGNVPGYPDNLAGTTYFQDAWATVDSWVASNGSLAVAGGIATLSATGANAGITRAITVAANRTFRLRVAGGGTYGNRTISIFNGTSETTKIVNITGAFQLVDITSALTFSNVTIRITNSVNGESYRFDWIYIGDGTYSSQALDLSGNGNHASIFGATPVDGGFSFDRINDYLTAGHSGSTFLDLSFQFLALKGLGGVKSFFAQELSGLNTRRIAYIGAADTIEFISRRLDGTTGITCVVPASAWESNLPTHIRFTQSGATISIWINGVLANSTTGLDFYDGYKNIIYFGRDNAAANYFSGTIRYPRIYNRALTAAEITELYEDPAAYAIDNVARATTPVPGSIVTRDANGDTQFATTFVSASGATAQTVGGVKTFSSIPVLPASNPTLANQAARKGYIDGKVPGIITISTSGPTGGADGDIWIQV